MSTGLHHVAMAIQDNDVYERTVTFYREVLGFALVRSWVNPPRRVTMLDMGSGMLEIVYGATGSGEGVFSHLALRVESAAELDALLERCEKAGCTLTRPARDVDAAQDDGGTFRFRNGFCQGLAGESLEFFCEY